MKKNKAFTLIELIAVLVILAILALIVTPLVMNIIRKARISADKRSIDAYGRSIEIAIATYLLDEGKFPSSINELTIEYSGDRVVCSTTQLNSDSSVYLTGCTVAGRSVYYSYGTNTSPSYAAYSIGDEVTYNNVDYYVIANSDQNDANVTLLKSEPLTVSEVNEYGVGHINRYTSSSVGTVYYRNGYGGIAYYSSETCGVVNSGLVQTGCTTSYESSDIKYVVDAWKNAQASASIEARLITYDELIDNLGFDHVTWNVSNWQVNPEYTPSFVFSGNYSYWTMSQYNDSGTDVWCVMCRDDMHSIVTGYNAHEFMDYGYPAYSYSQSFFVVRPVIVLPKSALD